MRALSVFLAFGLLTVALPLIACAAGVLALQSRGAPLFFHARVGQGGRVFYMVKLKTIWPDADIWDVPHWQALGHKPPQGRTGFAQALRSMGIDELPQLWNVLRGDMAFFGPRAITAQEIFDHYTPDMRAALQVKPGITGLWQLRIPNSMNYRRRARYDAWQIRRNGWGLRAYLTWGTLRYALQGAGR